MKYNNFIKDHNNIYVTHHIKRQFTSQTFFPYILTNTAVRVPFTGAVQIQVQEKKVYWLWIILVNSAAVSEHSTFSFHNIHFPLFSFIGPRLDLSVTCIAAPLINGHWLKIRPHAMIVLIKIHPSPWTRYHAMVCGSNSKPVDLFSHGW